MKTILCYGDSNTYGYNPENGLRYAQDIRWSGRLKTLLGSDYCVVEEGCNGRTATDDVVSESWKSGLYYIKPCLNSHKPIDQVILMLGTNDLKRDFHIGAEQAAERVGELVDVIYSFCKEKQGFSPVVILVSPPEIGENIVNGPFSVSFDREAAFESQKFSFYYKKIAEEKGCVFFDAATCCRVSEEDSLHLTVDSHKALADELAKIVRENFK